MTQQKSHIVKIAFAGHTQPQITNVVNVKNPKTEWKEARQNLFEMLKKYPNMAMNIIDSAYLAGIEANNNN